MSTPEPFAAPGGATDDPEDPLADWQPPPGRSRGARIARWAAIVTSVGIVGLWAFVYVWAAQQKPVDKLADPSFGREAQKICATTMAKLAELPPAQSSKTNVDRAAVVDQTDQELGSMLDQLAAVAPRAGTDGRMVHAWLDDYHTYLSNRVSYAQRLRTDPAARFYESEKQPGEQITIPIDTLATANGMDACTAPEDLS